MRAISFSWTTDAFRAGAKTVTRRDWKGDYAGALRAGDRLLALSKDRRAGGRPVGQIELTADPAYRPMATMPDSDYEAEGWQWLAEHPERQPARLFGMPLPAGAFSWEAFLAWRARPVSMWVVRFRVVTPERTVRP